MHIHLTNILLKRQGENVIQQSSNLLVSFLSIISSSFQSIDQYAMHWVLNQTLPDCARFVEN